MKLNKINMKRITILGLFALLFSTVALAQDDSDEIKTLFSSNGNRSNGGYGGLMINYGTINDEPAIFMGAKGGWVIDHSFTLGLAGYGFLADPTADIKLDNEKYQLTGGYGGLLLEPVVWSKQPIHFAFPIIIGAGGVGYVNHWDNWNDKDSEDYINNYEDSDAFFVLEPGVEIEINILKYFRIAINGSYRYTSNIDLRYKEDDVPIFGDDILRGWSCGLTFKFGKF